MKRRKLKGWVKQVIMAVIGVTVILSIVFISNYFDKETEKHIEKVSSECAEKGYGIKAYYTKEGDKFYKCNFGGVN